jgi:hypothetical protein
MWAAERHPNLSDGNIQHHPPGMLPRGRAPATAAERWVAMNARSSLREFDHRLWIVTFYREPFELRPIIEALRARAEREWRRRLAA